MDFAGQQFVIIKISKQFGGIRQIGMLQPLRDHGLVDDQFAYRVNQAINAFGVNAERTCRAGAALIGGVACFLIGHVARHACRGIHAVLLDRTVWCSGCGNVWHGGIFIKQFDLQGA
nr:hypothetical protein [Yoonia vestfoldensis]